LLWRTVAAKEEAAAERWLQRRRKILAAVQREMGALT
jgi:hypothetical protein